MKCEHCDIINGNSKAKIIFEDNEVVVAIKDLAVSPGQVTVFPKEHFTILELVPNNILEKCANLANKVGVAVFDGLAAQGTNILIKNGLGANQNVPHFSIDIIPRREEDGLDLTWAPKQLMEDEMETALMTLNKELDNVLKDNKEQETKSDEKVEKQGKGAKKEKSKEDKDNYLLKTIRRIP
ncbi:HIT family protein [Candidatus Woesearchaeota archaeon]|jgi:histidine triad (HIT) family protein|nr:HIT family protein [Candidatus Woesearchaeota archaeon]MBT4110702.1 HIT family protein [Candidatus Woesearchaeota archaeon]MBT4336298.1 HIT family protein [Candidatus Woesearchaeota archaeon]MBT4469341.1 HIT family protein [Candidatus Woesearchaeota archaeon]MBT6743836.1 HIT family protein [Candidatus Woesearchaeota archaeon]